MDKNMIKIDDFVRQRLSGGEEKERAGAWLQMRDLLDNKMPVRPAAGGYNWRRMLTAATGALLLASLTVGGYKMYTGFRPDNETSIAGNADASYEMPKEHVSFISDNNYNNNTTSQNENNEAIPSDDNKNINSNASESNVKGINHREDINHVITKSIDISNHLTDPKTKISRNNPNKNNTQARTNTTNNLNTEPSTYNSTNANSKALASGNTQTNSNNISANITGGNNNNNSSNGTTGELNNIAKTTPPAGDSKPAPVTQSASQLANPTVAIEKTAANGTKPVNQDNTATKGILILKDSMPKIAITEKVKVDPIRRTIVSSKDTTSVSKMVIEKPVVASNVVANTPNLNTSKPQTITAQANAGAIAKTENRTSSALKMRSQKSGTLIAERLKEMLIETQFRLGQVKFYTGITGGINNYMFGTNSMMGIQIGPRVTAVFDEKWSMFIEPKYMQRFNKNYVVKDNYWQVGEITGNEYKASEIEHFFKFSALHTIEMPIALRYQLFKQLHIFAGGNLVYNFKINAEEITRVSEERTYTGSSFGLPYQPSVHLDHFGSRFSAGYLLGLSYQVSPVFDIDARMTKNFWDNAAGSGPRKISDQLLYRPSLQLSIGYKFLQRNKIPPAK